MAQGGGKGTADPGKGAGRGLSVKLKRTAGRSVASQRWLQRQLNDPYVTAAQKQGYRSRAAVT
jgi:23S rRNA (uridine2552-2'-O)-methyltransferase